MIRYVSHTELPVRQSSASKSALTNNTDCTCESAYGAADKILTSETIKKRLNSANCESLSNVYFYMYL